MSCGECLWKRLKLVIFIVSKDCSNALVYESGIHIFNIIMQYLSAIFYICVTGKKEAANVVNNQKHGYQYRFVEITVSFSILNHYHIYINQSSLNAL